ncbi:ParA family protein [Pseudoalteromonas fuliginea]|uniref:Cobyrinic acid a,c-diamide synthase n=1 Tax=Pseudoalteromonas fuliginea TaxID=1872678 RepID=A0ABD3Y4H0_9GAMM|nr:AAA family ATPase [Pseudoalteromonas fuliginea]KDC48751.1 cobyrinic acid a,c-diamide synthase [Pseudoalteromonas fuliginea]KJZ27194.1 cobyrinic acid a,c-diamide synthase [Pseudoalteromonas fuliginea]
MEIVSVINYKGGVGKTTVTSNLAAELAWQGKSVLILDMDAQASLTFSFMTPDYWDNHIKESRTIKSWFDCISQGNPTMPLADLRVRPEVVNNFLTNNKRGGCVDLISSHLGLINVDLELATLLGGASPTQTQKKYLKVHGKLRDELNTLASEMNYDIVLIDCPPNFNIVTKNALIASDKILVPAKPDYLSTLGIDYLKKSVETLVEDFNFYAKKDDEFNESSPEFMGVVFTMIQITSGIPISAQRQYIAQTKRLGVPVFDAIFRENKTIFADAPRNGMPVVLNSYSNQSHTTVVDEIEVFVGEFNSKLGV